MTMLTGRYADTLWHATGGVIRSPWRSNLVVQSCHRLLALQLVSPLATHGISYWALGEGLSAWDDTEESPRFDDTQLTNEFARQLVPASAMTFLDDLLHPTPEVTHRIQVELLFSGAEFAPEPRVLREFALFGGDASAQANTGTMVNRVIHPALPFGPGDVLLRKLQLTMGEQVTDSTLLATGDFLLATGELPVSAISGVGASYAAALQAASVTTLSELAALDPNTAIHLPALAPIPDQRLREAIAKATCALWLRLPGHWPELGPLSVATTLKLTPETLNTHIPTTSLTAQDLASIRSALAPLEAVLDMDFLDEISMADLMQ